MSATASRALATAVAAGQETYDDAAEGDNRVDDCDDDAANAGDDSHDSTANGPEHVRDLKTMRRISF